MNKKAVALLLVLIVMIIAGIGCGAILQAMVSYTNMKIVSARKVKAAYLAEAGMQYAVYECQNGNFSTPFTITTEEWPIVIVKERQGDSYKITVTVQYPGI